jgi:hypothetical protein
MHKILTAVAVLALLALGTSIVATVVLRSSIDKQSRQIGALDRAETADHKEITALQGELRTTKAQHQLAAAAASAATRTQRCLPGESRPIGWPGLAVASPEFLLIIRQASSTAWNPLAGVPLSSDTSPPGRCG